MVYCDPDMCESKLGKLMQAFRADRPDEWQMDEFIQMAEQMHREIDRLGELVTRYESDNVSMSEQIAEMLDDLDWAERDVEELSHNKGA